MNPRRWVACAVTLATMGVSVLAVYWQLGYTAFQDLGEWIYHGATLSSLWQGQEPQNLAQFVDHPVPNALPQLLLGALTLLLGANLAGLTFLLLYAVAAALAVESLVQRFSLPPVLSALFLGATTVLGTGFWNGFISAQWGLVLLMFYWALPKDRATSWVALIGFSLLAFFTHGLTFASWGVMALARVLETGRFGRLVISVIPSGAFALWYFIASDEGTVGGLFNFEGGIASHLFYKGYTAAKMGAYQNLIVRGVGDAEALGWGYWLGVVANVVFVAAVLLLTVVVIVRHRNWLASQKGALIAAGILLVVTLVFPPYLFGVVNPGERTLAVLAIVLTPLLFGPAEHTRWARTLLVGSLTVGFAITAASLATISQKVASGDGPTPIVIGFEDRGETLFAHRLDQFEDRVKAAERSNLEYPLAFTTSVLTNP